MRKFLRVTKKTIETMVTLPIAKRVYKHIIWENRDNEMKNKSFWFKIKWYLKYYFT